MYSMILKYKISCHMHSNLKECQYEAVKGVVVDRKDRICILPTGYGKSLIYPLLPFVLLNLYFQRMRSASDIQFFVCRSRIIPEAEPPFPSQEIAGSGNEIANLATFRKNGYAWAAAKRSANSEIKIGAISRGGRGTKYMFTYHSEGQFHFMFILCL